MLIEEAGELESEEDPKFFQHGVGSQMMLASATSQAKQMLLDSARRHLSGHEIDKLQEKLGQVCGLYTSQQQTCHHSIE